MVSLGTIITKASPTVLSVEEIQAQMKKARHAHMKGSTVAANRAGMMRMLKIAKSLGRLKEDRRNR